MVIDSHNCAGESEARDNSLKPSCPVCSQTASLHNGKDKKTKRCSERTGIARVNLL